MGDVGEAGCDEEPVVWDFRTGTGLGAMIGGDLSLLCCHLSKTEVFLSLPLSAGDAEGLLEEYEEGLSTWLLALTILCTNPRPWSLLILGVGSLLGDVRK